MLAFWSACFDLPICIVPTHRADGVSGLGTVPRCHNPVVMPPLHGGLPPLGSWSLYIHICETKITHKIAEHHMRVLNEDNSLNAPPLAGHAPRGWSLALYRPDRIAPALRIPGLVGDFW